MGQVGGDMWEVPEWGQVGGDMWEVPEWGQVGGFFTLKIARTA